MAKRPKRFYEGGMDEKEPGWDSKSSEGGMDEKEPGWESGTAKAAPVAKAAPAPKAAPASEPSSIRKISRDEYENLKKASEPAKAEPKAETSAPAKKDTYYSPFTGKVETKKSTADRDAENAARREKVSSALKAAGSSIGSVFNKAIENYKSTVPRYNKEKKMASGGSVRSASSRADGIAQRGKTRGTIAAMCGGGMAKGKR